MRVVHKSGFELALSCVLAGASAMDSKGGAAETFVPATELGAKVLDVAGGMVKIADSGGPQVLMIRRDKTGDAEVHLQMSDTIVLEHGTGKFRVGGTITGNHETQPNEWRGGEMKGFREYTLVAGDLLVIPAGVPHQAVVTSGTFTYLAVKTHKQP